MDTVPLKRLFKQTFPSLPGYHALCLGLRKLRPEAWTWVDRLPVKPGMIVLVHSMAGDILMGRPERCSIAKKFFWTRGVRTPEEDRIALDLFTGLAKSADVVLDIGANSGLFSLAAAKVNPAAAVVAFDILPEAIHILFDNLILNDLHERVEVRLTGVGTKGAVFHAPFKSISSEMPTSMSLDKQEAAGCSARVPIKSLDEICLPRFAGKKMCIKIDVEGTEGDIFAFGRETLSKIKPDIICEVLTVSRAVDMYDQILSDHSYQKYLITPKGLREFNKVKPDLRYRDWLFTTRNNRDIEIEELLK